MSFKELRQKPWFRIASNKYLLIFVVFACWMAFFDSNSLLVHGELNQEIEKLENNRDYYQTEIAHDQQLIKNLKGSSSLEKYAREKYFMKRENEDIYIIEIDSLNNN